MKAKRIIAAILIVILTVVTAIAAAGGADDPLVSLGYLYGDILSQLRTKAEHKRIEKLDALYDGAFARLKVLEDAEISQFAYAGKFTPLELDRGGTVTMDSFACIIIQQGRARLTVTEGEVINISDGTACASGEMLKPLNRYFAAEDSRALVRVYLPGTCVMIDGYYEYSPSGEIPTEESFIDVGAGHWASGYIYRLADMNAVNGVGDDMFEPESTVTRAAFVTILGRLSGADMSAYTHTEFSDADISQWYGPYVAWAAEKGITTGYDDGEFRPMKAITREEMAVMMLRFADSGGYELPEDADTPPFSDADSISPWAAQAVEKARASGLMNGRGDNAFAPSGTATRAEICAVACRFMTLSGMDGGE